MKHALLGLAIILGTWSLGPTPEADARSWRNGRSHGKRHIIRRIIRRHQGKKTPRVPELDPSAAGSAMVLLLGGAAYVLSRRRRDDELSY